MENELLNQINFEVNMTKDFLDFLVSMKVEGLETMGEFIEVLEDMVSKPYVKPPLSEQLQSYIVVSSNLEKKGVGDIGSAITFMSGFYIEQTSGEFYRNEQ